MSFGVIAQEAPKSKKCCQRGNGTLNQWHSSWYWLISFKARFIKRFSEELRLVIIWSIR